MIKVWILEKSELYEGGDIVGVFSGVEGALKALHQLIEKEPAGRAYEQFSEHGWRHGNTYLTLACYTVEEEGKGG